MQLRDPGAILAKLGERSLKIDSFFLRRTGFIANQTILKLAEYSLNCLPATIGSTEGQFLAALSPTELNLFSKFKEGIHLLMLTFDSSDGSDVARFPLRVGLVGISPVPDRKGICLLTLKFKALPTEFLHFLGDFMDDLEERTQAWESLAGESYVLSAEIAQPLGLALSAALDVEAETVAGTVREFTTKRILLVPFGAPAELMGKRGQLRLLYHNKPLPLVGTLIGPEEFAPDFSIEWLDVVRQVKHRKEFQQAAERKGS